MKLEDDILIERFLKNELSKEETQSFLDRLNVDADFKERVILERQLFDSLDENSWSFIEEKDLYEVNVYEAILTSSETKNIKKAIEEAQESYQNSQKPSKNWLLYVAAAIIVVLFSTLIFNTKPQSNQDLFASYLQETNLLSLVDRGEYNSVFNIAQTSFDNKEYSKVVNTLSGVVDTVNSGNAYIYLAISQIEIKNYANAEQTLDKLINSDLLDSQKGYWYKGLLYLKSDQIEKSKKELKNIIQNSYYNFEKAKELLKEIR